MYSYNLYTVQRRAARCADRAAGIELPTESWVEHLWHRMWVDLGEHRPSDRTFKTCRLTIHRYAFLFLCVSLDFPPSLASKNVCNH